VTLHSLKDAPRPALRPAGKARPKTPTLGRPRGKFTQHQKLSKLHELLEKHPQGLTIPEIAAALRLTTRSVRRYLTYLRGRDAADALESIPEGTRGVLRWRMNPRDRGRAMNLRRTQAYGLLALRRALDALRGSALFDEIEIVTDQILLLARRPVHAGKADIASDTRMEERFVFVPEVTRPQAQGPELDDVFRAVADLRVLTFRLGKPRAYGTRREAKADRGTRMTVHPYAMVVHAGEAHCIARDVSSGQVDVYPLSRMHESEASESERFELPDDFDVDDYVHGPFGLGRPTHPILVEFTADVAEEIRAQRIHPSQRLATSRDGRLLVSLTVPSLDAAVRWVLRFGSSARVVEPIELQSAVYRELKTALQRYSRP
jgi:predicted DNA-binding transcriptional regulator YafY